MTNGKTYQGLTQEQQKDFRKTYQNHLLVDYIDWKAFYDSENGNAMDFVQYLDKYTDEKGQTVYVLDKLVENDMDYKLIFVCEENTFYKVPDTDEE